VKTITIINGPNLNLLGKREPEVYGTRGFEDYLFELTKTFSDIKLHYYQSNSEGEIIDKLHQAAGESDGVLINPGGFTHTSVAIADAIRSIKTPVIEIHISNIQRREDYRKVSLIAEACAGSISGLGLDSYRLGIEHLVD